MIEDQPKISDLFLDFFNTNRDNLPGASRVGDHEYGKMIQIGALDFLKSMCGDIYQDITDDENLNAEIIDTFAQTFVSHFWNNEIGYDDEFIFSVKLSAFLNEQLPLWAEYYKELIVMKGGFKNVVGEIKVNGNNALHSTSTTLQDIVNNTTGNNVRNSTTNVTNTTDNKQNSVVSGTNSENNQEDTTTTDDEQASHDTDNVAITRDNQLNAESDTPQDAIDFKTGFGRNSGTFELNGDKYDVDEFKPQNIYGFDYASKVTGNWDGTNTRNMTTDKTNGTKKGTSSVKGAKTGSNNSTTTDTGNTKQIGETTNKDTDQNNVVQKNNGTTDIEGSQTGSNSNNTVYSQRTMPVADLVRGLNHIANGAYSNLFIVAKRAGLFMLDYE